MRQSIREWILCFFCLEKRTIARKKRIFLIPLLLFTAFFLSSCRQKKEPVTKTGFYFDTVINITLYGDNETLSPLFDEIFALCAHYESILSRTVKSSDISLINEAAGSPVSVHPETLSLLQTACAYAEMADGLIDPTVMPLLLLWGFEDTPSLQISTGTDADTPEDAEGSVPPFAPQIPPDPNALAEALSHVDYHSIVIDEQAGTVMLTDPHAAIDLGFIAKGYIADRIRDYLLSQHVTSAIINLGGNVLCIGEKPDHSPYRVAVKYPFGGVEDVIATLPIQDQSVVTSGVYERFVESDGVRYHHILNPQTGYPMENGLLSVTIVTDSSTDADALSTACFVLGLSDGMRLIESLEHTEALFITEDYELHYSSGLKENR